MPGGIAHAFGLATVVFLVGPAFSLVAQNLEIEVEGIELPKSGLSLQVQPEDDGMWTVETRERLKKCERGEKSNSRLYFDYDQGYLNPDAEQRCYLHLLVVDPSRPSPSGSRAVWFESFRLKVRGKDFIDQEVPLKVTVRKDGIQEIDTIKVTAHQTFPNNALISQWPEGLYLDVPTGEPSPWEISFQNKSCCDIKFLQAEARPGWEVFFAKAALHQGPAVLKSQESKYQPWLILDLEPKPSAAFWRSFIPYDEKNPHARLIYDISFKVEGGRPAIVSQSIFIRFKPAFSLVIASVVAGAVLASLVSLAIVGFRKGKEPVVGKASRFWPMVGEVAKRMFLSVVAAVLIFFLYGLIKGDKRVILFDYSLDPTQCIPAFFIGVLVGSQPIFYYRLITKPPGSKGSSSSPRATLASFFLLGLFAAPLQADDAGFRPVALSYDAETDTLFVLSSTPNSLYRLKASGGRLQKLTKLGPIDVATDSCLLSWKGEPWIATTSNRALSSATPWQMTISLTRVQSGANIPSTSIGFGRFSGIACDSTRQRLLLTDSVQEGIYTVPLTPSGIGRPSRLFSSFLLQDPSAIAIYKDQIFVAARESGVIYRIELSSGSLKLKPVVKEVGDAAGLFLTPDGSSLFVADASGAKILEYTLATGVTRVRLQGPFMREPRAVVQDREGRLWVADAWAGAILEFGSEGGPPRRHIP